MMLIMLKIMTGPNSVKVIRETNHCHNMVMRVLNMDIIPPTIQVTIITAGHFMIPSGILIMVLDGDFLRDSV